MLTKKRISFYLFSYFVSVPNSITLYAMRIKVFRMCLIFFLFLSEMTPHEFNVEKGITAKNLISDNIYHSCYFLCSYNKMNTKKIWIFEIDRSKLNIYNYYSLRTFIRDISEFIQVYELTYVLKLPYLPIGPIGKVG